MPNLTRPLDSREAYNAIVHLLEEQGIDFVCDELLVNEVVTPSGDTLYVVIASNDIERAVKGATAWPAIALMSDYKTFALSQQQVVELVQNARRLFFKPH